MARQGEWRESLLAHNTTKGKETYSKWHLLSAVPRARRHRLSPSHVHSERGACSSLHQEDAPAPSHAYRCNSSSQGSPERGAPRCSPLIPRAQAGARSHSHASPARLRGSRSPVGGVGVTEGSEEGKRDALVSAIAGFWVLRRLSQPGVREGLKPDCLGQRFR